MVLSVWTILVSCVSRRDSPGGRSGATGLDASMISAPSNFVHLSHVGMDDFDDEKVMQSFSSFAILLQQRNKQSQSATDDVPNPKTPSPKRTSDQGGNNRSPKSSESKSSPSEVRQKPPISSSAT